MRTRSFTITFIFSLLFLIFHFFIVYADESDFTYDENGALTGYTGSDEVVVIPDGVPAIGSGAFKDNTVIISVEIPDSVTSIGSAAFRGCTNLVQVTLSENLTSIGNSAFYNCSNLHDIDLPESLTSLQAYAFFGCSSLENITIPSQITSIGYQVFQDCRSLKNVVLPSGLNLIGSHAFEGCSSLSEIELPEGLTGIDLKAFYHSGLTKIDLPETLTGIGESAFQGCGLDEITIPASVGGIYDNAFANCGLEKIVFLSDEFSTLFGSAFKTGNKPTEIQVPASFIGTISSYFDPTNLQTLVFTGSASEIPKDSFKGFSNLKSVVLPDGITKIGGRAFSGCSSLVDFSIPENVNSIGYGAFYGCSSLTNLIVPDLVTTISYDTFGNCSGLESISIPASVTSIGIRAFQGCSNLTNIVLPDNITIISDDLFNGCSQLTSVNIPDDVTSIGANAFYGTRITSLEIPDNVVTIGNDAFHDCQNLTSIQLPESVTSLGSGIFYGCSSLESINIPENITTIESNSFRDCSSLESIEFSNNILVIGSNAFYGCSNLQEIDLPDGLTEIGREAFRKCTDLRKIKLPSNASESDLYLDLYIFYECPNIEFLSASVNILQRLKSIHTPIANVKTFIITGDSTEIPENTFVGFTSLEGITIPEGIITIGNGAFEDCSSLASVSISESVTTIGDNAFKESSNLEFLHIPSAVQTIGENSFNFHTLLEVTRGSEAMDYAINNEYRFILSGENDSTDHPWAVVGKVLYAYIGNETEVEIPRTITGIGPRAFMNTNVTDLTIQETVTSIDENENAIPSNIVIHTFPDAAAVIAYAEANGNEYHVDGSVDGFTIIDNVLLTYTGNKTDIVIPEHVKEIAPYALANNMKLQKVTISEGTEIIGNHAFDNSLNISEIIIPNTVTTLGVRALSPGNTTTDHVYSALKKIVIPDSVTKIGSEAIDRWTTIWANPGSKAAQWAQVFGKALRLNGEPSDGFEIATNVITLDMTLIHYTGDDENVVIPEDIVFIGGHSFEDNTSLENIVISNTVTTIESYAFSGCTGLNSISISDSVKIIQPHAFEACSALKEVVILENVEEIGDDAFPVSTVIYTREGSAADLWGTTHGNTVYYLLDDGTVGVKSVQIFTQDGEDVTGKTIEVNIADHQLTAVVLPKIAAQTIIWSSSNASIATINSEGKVTFLKPGSATFTAESTDGSNKSAWVKLKLLPEAEAITITNSKGTDITGKTITSNTLSYQLKAKADPSNAAQTVTWKSSNTNTATVTSAGKVTFKKAGIVQITATSTDRGRVTAAVKLKLLPEATAVIITNSKGTVITGKTITSNTVSYQLKAKADPSNAAQTVTWKSSNTSTATVTKTGKVTFKKAGIVQITATSTDRGKKTAIVKLKLLPKATKIVIRDPKGKIINGKTVVINTKTYKLKAAAKPLKAEQTVTWKSGNTNIATVTKAGKVTFKKAGTVVITATSTDRGKKYGKVRLTYKP